MRAGAEAPGRVRVAPSPGQRPAEDGGPADFVQALERVSRRIHDPVAKLRYIRATLARYERVDRAVQRVPVPLLRRWVYRRLSLQGLRYMLSRHPLDAPPPVPASLRRRLQLGRSVTVLAALAVTAALATAVYRPARPDASVALAALGPASAEAPSVPAAPARPPVAESLAPAPAGLAATGVWLVEKGDGWEQYSNGLRIDTRYQVTGDPRRFRVFHSQGLQPEVQDAPIGILFHTSESDVWPLEAAFNENLRDSSQRLLRYVRRLKLYHYTIDRFGRVYRVVEEDRKANHAGNSVWARDDRIYLNLNNAFLGICFESRWEGAQAMPITQAQLAAGRNLTEYLRRRWSIAPEMCVTHGLTSVNPRKHLIGHHLDWARGFPFEAFGLPDQYDRPAPAVALFGFGYDEDFVRVLGEPWAGVRHAEQALAQEARRRGTSLDQLRREKQELYDRWLSEQALAEQAQGASRADRESTRGIRGG